MTKYNWKYWCPIKKNINICIVNWKQIINFAPSEQMKEEMEEKPVFRLILSVEADSFLQSIPEKAREKVRYNIRRIQKGEQNKELFKKLDGTEIWEFRTLFNKIAYRLFAFWDTETETLVIATHGIIKKTQKTPSKEIARAEEIRKLYFELKKKK